MIKIDGDKATLYQWDLNQRVVLTSIPSITAGIEVHYSGIYNSEECCLIAPSYLEGDNMYADIPNKLLQQSGIISVYLYVQEENKAWTEHKTEILVIPRSKPTNYVYTETEVLDFKDLEKRLKELEKTDIPLIVSTADNPVNIMDLPDICIVKGTFKEAKRRNGIESFEEFIFDNKETIVFRTDGQTPTGDFNDRRYYFNYLSGGDFAIAYKIVYNVGTQEEETVHAAIHKIPIIDSIVKFDNIDNKMPDASHMGRYDTSLNTQVVNLVGQVDGGPALKISFDNIVGLMKRKLGFNSSDGLLPITRGGTGAENVYQAARRLGRTTYNYSGNPDADIVIELTNFPCVYGCEFYVCMKNGNTKAGVNMSVNGTNLPVYDAKTGAKLTGKEISPYQMCTFQLAEACDNLPKRWVLMNSTGASAIEKIELADGKQMDFIDLPPCSIITGIFYASGVSIPSMAGGVRYKCNNVIALKQNSLEVDGEYTLTLFSSETRKFTVIERKFTGINIENLTGWSVYHHYYNIEDIGLIDPTYELITRKTFDQLDILNGNIPEGKTEAWREKTINFDKKYKALLFMLYFDVQDDLSTTRDCNIIANGDESGMFYLGMGKVMTNTETRYTRGKIERKNGLWWLEYTDPVKSRGNASPLKTTQTGFGFASDRIDAEEGIVDETHLGSTENITSFTFQTTMPSNGNGRQNPKGAIALFGIPV